MSVRLTPRGLPVTTASPAAADALHRFEEEILGYGQGAGVVFDAVDADPQCALAQALAAVTHLFRSTREGEARARAFLDAARAGAADTDRERRLIDAVAAWSRRDVAGAVRILVDGVEAEPRDLLAAKLLQYLQFSTGDAWGMRRTSACAVAAHPDDPRVLAMHAFALDQCGDRRGAEATARRALGYGDDPWAHHALAHVFDAEGRYAEGRWWMAAHAGSWAGCSSFLYTHNWWHAALFHIEAGDREGALALYDARVWTMRKDYTQDQINAVALLARLELAGLDVRDRWAEVAAQVAPRRADAADAFLDLHYAYALARAGDAAGVHDLVRAAEARAGDDAGRAVAPEAALGLAAHAWGRHAEAGSRLARVHAGLHRVGGSTVQRELFTRVAVDALLRSGRPAVARTLLGQGLGSAWRRRQAAALLVAEPPARAPRVA